MVAVAQLHPVDGEAPRHFGHHRDDEVPHLVMGEVQGRALPVMLALPRTLGDQEPGVVDDEACPGPDPLCRRDGAVVVVDAKTGEALDAAAVALIDEDFEWLHSGIEQGQEAPVLGPRVVLEVASAPVHGPSLGVYLLDEGVDFGGGDGVDPAPQILFANRIGKVPGSDA